MFTIFNSDAYHSSRMLNQNFGMEIKPEDIAIPTFSFYNNNYFRPWNFCAQIQDNGSVIRNEKDLFKISLDVQQFRPTELFVKTTTNEVIIEGKHEERADEHGFISRQFLRRYKLPDNCIPETVTSNLTSDGVLIISAPKQHMKCIEEKERVVPIKMPETGTKVVVSQNEELKYKNENLQQEVNKIKSGTADIKLNRIQLEKDDHCLMKTTGKFAQSTEDSYSKQSNEIKMRTCDEKSQLDKSDKADISGHTSIFSNIMQNEDNLFNEMKLSKPFNELKVKASEEMLQMATSQFNRSNVDSKTEMSSFSSTSSSESMKSKETFSSMALGLNATAEYVNQNVSSELKQAAKNV